MAFHTFRLVYDGLGATNHRMPTSLEKQVTAGAQEFLGAHAYFLTEGRVPPNVYDHSKYFQICDLRQKDGSWEALFDVQIVPIEVLSDFLKQYVQELTKNLAVEAALATKLAFIYLVRASYKAWKSRDPMKDQTFDRVQSVLIDLQGNGAPIFDPLKDAERQRRLLYERTNSSMAKLTAPIGRAALHVDIWLDNEKFDRLERRVITEEEIAAALLPIRERRDEVRQRH